MTRGREFTHVDPAKIAWGNTSPVSRPRPSRRQAAPGVTPAPVADRAEIKALSTGKSAEPAEGQKLGARQLAMMGLLALGVAQTVGTGIHMVVSGHKATQSATQEILEHDHDLSPEQHFFTTQEMRQMDDGVVRYLAHTGLELQITETDSEVAEMLRETGRLNPANPVKLSAEAVQAHAVGELVRNDSELRALSQRETEIGERLAEIQMDRLKDSIIPGGGFSGGMGAMGGGGGASQYTGDSQETPPQRQEIARFGGSMMGRVGRGGGKMAEIPPEMQELVDQRFEIGALKEARMKRVLKENGLPSGWAGQMPGAPFNFDQILSMSGAESAEQKAEFRNLFEVANGDRLLEARKAALEQMQRALDKAHPQSREFFSQRLANLRANPDQLPLDRVSFGILVPDLQYQQLEGGEHLRLRTSDRTIGNIGAMGLYMPGDGKAQVDAGVLDHKSEKVVIHELGHALEFALEANDPEFFEDWSVRRDTAFAQAKAAAKEGAKPNSHYGLTNQREYVAEGVEAFYDNPKHLKERDPALYELTAELVSRGAEHVAEDHQAHLTLMAAGLAQTALVGLALAAQRRREQPQPANA